MNRETSGTMSVFMAHLAPKAQMATARSASVTTLVSRNGVWRPDMGDWRIPRRMDPDEYRNYMRGVSTAL